MGDQRQHYNDSQPQPCFHQDQSNNPYPPPQYPPIQRTIHRLPEYDQHNMPGRSQDIIQRTVYNSAQNPLTASASKSGKSPVLQTNYKRKFPDEQKQSNQDNKANKQLVNKGDNSNQNNTYKKVKPNEEDLNIINDDDEDEKDDEGAEEEVEEGDDEGIAKVTRDQHEDNEYNIYRLEGMMHYVCWVDIHNDPDILYMRKIIRTNESGMKGKDIHLKEGTIKSIKRQIPLFWGSKKYKLKISEVFRVAEKYQMAHFWTLMRKCKQGEKPNPLTPLLEKTGIMMCCVHKKKEGTKKKLYTRMRFWEYNDAKHKSTRKLMPFYCPALEPEPKCPGTSRGKNRFKR